MRVRTKRRRWRRGVGACTCRQPLSRDGRSPMSTTGTPEPPRLDPSAHQRRTLWWVLIGTAVVLVAAAAAFPDWLEKVANFDPDNGNGTFEAGLAVLAIIAVAVAATLIVYRQVRRSRARRVERTT